MSLLLIYFNELYNIKKIIAKLECYMFFFFKQNIICIFTMVFFNIFVYIFNRKRANISSMMAF